MQRNSASSIDGQHQISGNSINKWFYRLSWNSVDAVNEKSFAVTVIDLATPSDAEAEVSDWAELEPNIPFSF